MQLVKHVKFREEKFGGVLFETQSEKVYTLNPTAAAVVREIKAGGDAATITARIRDRFQDPTGKIEQEIAALLQDLREKGLVADTAS